MPKSQSEERTVQCHGFSGYYEYVIRTNTYTYTINTYIRRIICMLRMTPDMTRLCSRSVWYEMPIQTESTEVCLVDVANIGVVTLRNRANIERSASV